MNHLSRLGWLINWNSIGLINQLGPKCKEFRITLFLGLRSHRMHASIIGFPRSKPVETYDYKNYKKILDLKAKILYLRSRCSQTDFHFMKTLKSYGCRRTRLPNNLLPNLPLHGSCHKRILNFSLFKWWLELFSLKFHKIELLLNL